MIPVSWGFRFGVLRTHVLNVRGCFSGMQRAELVRSALPNALSACLECRFWFAWHTIVVQRWDCWGRCGDFCWIHGILFG